MRTNCLGTGGVVWISSPTMDALPEILVAQVRVNSPNQQADVPLS